MAEFVYSAQAAAAVTISDTAKAIDHADFGFTVKQLAKAKLATLGAATAGIRFLYTGDDPTTTFGYVLSEDSILDVRGKKNVNNLIFIRSGAVDATLTITLEW